MKNVSLYHLPFKALLFSIKGPEKQLDLGIAPYRKSGILLYLEDFDLRKENLNEFVDCQNSELVTSAATTAAVGVNKDNEYSEILHKAKMEFIKTGKIKGRLFLTPDFQKIWISHYGLKHLVAL